MSEPQPISNADANKGGANGQCPGGAYCSTRDGSPSMNGNGNGKAVGKPCAGCVGKADNKNPKGQRPNGSDHNAGYECDRNHGIGRTNPAHTGCQATTPPPPPGECVPTPSDDCGSTPPPPGECVPTPSDNCGETPPGGNPPGENPPGVNRPPTDIAGVDTERPPSNVTPPAALPATGAPDRMGLVGGGGAALVVVGGLTLWRQRRARVTR